MHSQLRFRIYYYTIKYWVCIVFCFFVYTTYIRSFNRCLDRNKTVNVLLLFPIVFSIILYMCVNYVHASIYPIYTIWMNGYSIQSDHVGVLLINVPGYNFSSPWWRSNRDRAKFDWTSYSCWRHKPTHIQYMVLGGSWIAALTQTIDQESSRMSVIMVHDKNYMFCCTCCLRFEHFVYSLSGNAVESLMRFLANDGWWHMGVNQIRFCFTAVKYPTWFSVRSRPSCLGLLTVILWQRPGESWAVGSQYIEYKSKGQDLLRQKSRACECFPGVILPGRCAKTRVRKLISCPSRRFWSSIFCTNLYTLENPNR